eukprot:Rhum_TRINITY_DN14126_c0_g1::Rhum_TRINITY_DN14126_c0_g1_i1::g.69891::m.69891
MRLALAVLAPVCALASFSDLASHDSTPAVLPQGESVMMHSTTGEEAAILSDPLPSSDWSLAVDVLRHDMFGTNYEGHLVLFLAPDTAGLDDVATNDNAFDTFLNTMVATLQVRIHATSAHTWLRVRIGDVAYEIDVLHRLTTGGVRISREGSFVRCQYRLPGTSSWVDIGAGGELAAGTSEASVKTGVRVRREWLSSYHIEVAVQTSPLVSCAAPATPAPVPTPAFVTTALTARNVDKLPRTFSQGPDGSVTLRTKRKEEAAIVVKAPHEGVDDDGLMIAEAVVAAQEMNGDGYQSSPVLFFADAGRELHDTLFLDDVVQTGVAAWVRATIHATIDHTWFDAHDAGNSGHAARLRGGYTLRLERRNGRVVSSVRVGSGPLLAVGDSALPEKLRTAPLKAGVAVLRRYDTAYSITFAATLRSGPATTEPPTPAPTALPPLPPACPPAHAATGLYVPKGIGGGGAMSGLSISPHDDLWFVGTDMGTLFRSENKGQIWEPVSHAEIRYTNYLKISTGVGFTGDAKTVVFAACQLGIECVAKRSTDAGVTWSPVDINTKAGDLTASGLPRLSAFPRYWVTSLSSGLVFCAAADRLYRSTDYGATWAPVAHEAAAGEPVGTYLDESVSPPVVYHATARGLRSWTDAATVAAAQVHYAATPDVASEALLSFAAGRTGDALTMTLVDNNTAACGDWGAVYESCGYVHIDVGGGAGFAATHQRGSKVYMASNDASVAYVTGGRAWKVGRGTTVWVGRLGGDGAFSFARKFVQSDVETGYSMWPKEKLEYSAVGLEVGYFDGGYYWFTVNPVNSAEAGGSGNFFLHTTRDAGEHWQSPFTEHGDCGKEREKGDRWRSVGLEMTSVRHLKPNPHAPNQMFASVADIAMLRTFDGGDTYQVSKTGLPDSLNTMYDYAFASEAVVFGVGGNFHDWPHGWYKQAIRGSGGVFVSFNAGDTWRRLGQMESANCDDRMMDTNCTLQDDMVRQFLSVAYDAENGVLYAGSHGGGVARLRGVRELVTSGSLADLDVAQWEWVNGGLAHDGDLEGGVIVPEIRLNPSGTVFCLLTSNPPANTNLGRTGVYEFFVDDEQWRSHRGVVNRPPGTSAENSLWDYPTSFALDPATGQPAYVTDIEVNGNYMASGIWRRSAETSEWDRKQQFTHAFKLDVVGSRVYASGDQSMTRHGERVWGHGGAMHSDDGGETWSTNLLVPLLANVCSVTADPRDPSKVFYTFFGGGMMHGPAP